MNSSPWSPPEGYSFTPPQSPHLTPQGTGHQAIPSGHSSSLNASPAPRDFSHFQQPIEYELSPARVMHTDEIETAPRPVISTTRSPYPVGPPGVQPVEQSSAAKGKSPYPGSPYTEQPHHHAHMNPYGIPIGGPGPLNLPPGATICSEYGHRPHIPTPACGIVWMLVCGCFGLICLFQELSKPPVCINCGMVLDIPVVR